MRSKRERRSWSWLGLPAGMSVLALFACAADAPTAAPDIARPQHYDSWPDPLAHLPRGPEQTARVCERRDADSVLEVFCMDQPAPTSLAALQARLHVGRDNLAFPQTDTATHAIAHSLAITGHSTGLSKRSVSAINPRLVLQRTAVPLAAAEVPPLSPVLALAFSRGEQLVELAVSGYNDRRLRFYIVAYRQACNSRPEGCAPHDLLTEATERDWTEVSLYDEQDLANTVLDCATCHQPGGPSSRKLLRMQEIDVPWTHWFMTTSEGGRALIEDYSAAHADEVFAGMPSEQISRSDPNSLSLLVFTSGPQPTSFASKQIEQEIKDSAAALGGDQPFDNSVPGMSPTWQASFERALRGERIAVPYHNVKVTDPDKLATMTDAYRAYRAGERADLPDIREVFPDDPVQLAELGVTTPAGLSGEQVLMAACAQCHNAQLDQSLSRARFRADLQGMTRAQRDLAIERLRMAPDDGLAMPPARLRVLTDEARQRAIEVLTRDESAPPTQR
jgi:hypothetical protein